ncbi:MAG: hypothetical protein OEN50_20275 [Deltaproteobacteria bacterium]|nr:hypothetical protein [Deltaproteobacteria bacterium]
MPSEISLDQLRAEAVRAGLHLDEEELKKLLPGVNRSRKQVAELRDILSDGDEPAGIFSAKLQKE